MKKTNQILIAVVLLLFTYTFNGQTHVITLNVDTNNLTRDNVSTRSISYFSAPTAQVDIAFPPEDFEITVEDGATIIWEGASFSNPDDTVDIQMIKWEKGPKIFASDKISENNNGCDEIYVLLL